MNDDQLAAELRERGFSLSHSVRIADAGPRKINVIKAVRALTGWGLKDAKDATEQGATILERADEEAAARAAAKLRKAGAKIELGLAEARLFACDPHDDRRGNQPIERLRVHDRALVHEHGTLGAWVARPLEQRSTAELLAAIDERLATWSAEQKRVVTSERELLEAVSSRDLAAEQRLRDAEGEDRAREAAVYGDWLQTVGDPRGLIAAADLVANADTDARLAQLDALASANAAHLFGAAASLLDGASWTWSGPVLDTLILRDSLRGQTTERLAELLAIPAAACLRALTIEQPPEPELGLGRCIGEAACAPGLRSLRIPGTRLEGDRFARLTDLVIRGRPEIERLHAPSLRSLIVDMSAPWSSLRACFAGLDAPRLEHFHLLIATYDYWDQNMGPLQSNLAELLREPAFTRLRSLTLTMAEGSLDLTIGLADLIARFPASATLESIDLREAILAPACRAELERARDRLPTLLLPEA